MATHIFWRSGLLGLSTACVLTVALVACATSTANGADSWKEEVLLHDGQKIIVERSQTYKGRSEPGQPAPIGEHTIRFALPGSGKQITWVSEYGEDIGRANFYLKALHVKSGVPFVIAEPNLCLAYNKWGRPNPPYVVFQHDGNAWQRIAFETLPPEFKTINVVQHIQDADLRFLVEAGQVSVEQVARLNRDLVRAESRAIVREALPQERIVEMCGDRILYKGYWILPNDSVARRLIDSRTK
jgi:hypothetical protein